MTPCLPCPEGSSGEIYLLRRRGRRNQAGGLRIRLRMAMARAHLAPFLTTSHRRRCRHSEVLTPVRKSKNGGSPKIGDFRGWVENPRIPGVGRCLDRGLQTPRGDRPLWLGANNPTPGLRKTLTAPASRRGPWSLGACALGAPTSGGEKSASSAKDISDLFRGR